MREKRISWNVFAQAVYTIALPIAFQNLLSTTASMVDTIMIGSMGELSVAAGRHLLADFVAVFLLLFRICRRRAFVLFPVLGCQK